MPNVIVTRNTYPDAIALENVIHYVLDKAIVRGGYAVDCGSFAALEQMLFVKQAFRKSEALQLKHFFITFADNEMDLTDFDELLRRLGLEFHLRDRQKQLSFSVLCSRGRAAAGAKDEKGG